MISNNNKLIKTQIISLGATNNNQLIKTKITSQGHNKLHNK